MSKKAAPPLLNPEQQLVAEHHYGPLRVVACAGSGKTTALIERVVHLITKHRVPPARILAISFSKNAEKEMSKRLAKRLPDYDVAPIARTFHSIGYEIFKAETVDMKTWMMDSSGSLYRRALYQSFSAAKIDPAIKIAMRFASRVKNDMITPPDDAYDLEDVGDEMLELATEIAKGSPLTPDDLLSVYYMAERFRSEVGIDEGGLKVRFVTFDDMLYSAALLLRQNDVQKRWASRWDFVLQDECFVGDTPVLTGPGETMTIKEMVDTKYNGTVLAWKPDIGVVERRVVGWSRTPSSKPMVRVVVRRRGYRKDGRRLSDHAERLLSPLRYLVCTSDHPVWTPSGWVSAGQLTVGDTVQQESVAPYVSKYANRYKLSDSGLASLGRHMTVKNDAGICGADSVRGVITKRGGNGHGPTPTEAAMLERLGQGWVWNLTVKTRLAPGPRSYKIDIAHPVHMIALELDGGSHRPLARQEQDARKDAFLRSAGWTVVRMTNHEAAAIADEILHQRLFNSPVDAEVIRVEPWIPKDPYVYDITVDDAHCFYADGVLVHNCQDECEVQAQIAEALCREHKNYMVVGDPAQSIFGFRGARPERILTFDRHWPSAKTVMMHRNYRSGIEVVSSADRLMKEMPDGTVLRFTMTSERQTKAVIDCHAFDDEDLEAKAIAENCAKHSEAVHWRDQAVLVRMNYMTMPIEVALATSGIPYRLVSGTSFFGLRETKILLGYLRVAMNRADAEDLEHALLYPSRFMSRAFIGSVGEMHRSHPDWLEAVSAAATRSPSKQSDAAMVWVRFIRALRACCTGQKWTSVPGLSMPVSLIGPATPYQALTIVNDVTQMQEWLKRASDNDEENDSLENLARVMSFAAGFHSIPEMLDAVDRIEAHRKAYMRSGDAVTISTVHKFKGLESKVVYLAGAAEMYFPVAKADRNEERRLFYVAVTRAMDELWISWPEATTDGAGRLEKSSFLREAGLELTPDPFAPGPRAELGRRGDQMSLI